jgi:hypothetical protein
MTKTIEAQVTFSQKGDLGQPWIARSPKIGA